MTGQASDLHLQSHKIVPYTEASRVQMLMEASQTAPFKAEEYCNLAFKQPHITTQPILFGHPISTTVPKNHLHSDFPPVFQFFLREPIAFPSQAVRNWPNSVCHFADYIVPAHCSCQVNDMVNKLEQAWDTECLSSNERLNSRFTPEQRGILILVCDRNLQALLYIPLTSTKRYIECLPSPLLHVDKQMVSLLNHRGTNESIKIDAMVNKWQGTLQGNMATEIFVRLEDLLDEVDDEWWSWMTRLFTRRGVSVYLYGFSVTSLTTSTECPQFQDVPCVCDGVHIPTFTPYKLQFRLVVTKLVDS